MRIAFLGIMAFILVARSQGAAEELLVFTVNLEGNPENGIEVRLRGGTSAISRNGVARLQASLNPVQGSETIEINVTGSTNLSQIESDVIGRVKRIQWGSGKQDFRLGFVVPLWKKGQVKKYADAIVRDPGISLSSRFRLSQFTQGPAVTRPSVKRFTVAVRFDDNAPGGALIVAKAAEADDTWIERVAPTLPTVNMPGLASGLYNRVEVGADVPAYYAQDIARVKAEVQEINRQTQLCLRFPGGAAQPPGPNAPNQPAPGTHRQDQHSPTFPPSAVAGKVFINNRGSCEFDLLLNNHPIRIRGNGRTTVPVSLGNVTTEISGQPNSKQVWNNWMLLGNEYVLCINAHSDVRRRLARDQIMPGERRSYYYPPVEPAKSHCCCLNYLTQMFWVPTCSVYFTPGDCAPTIDASETRQPSTPYNNYLGAQ